MRRLPIAGLLSIALAGSPVQASASAHTRHANVDRGVQQALRTGSATQQVIITVSAGHRAEIRAALEKHGDRIKADHPMLDALSVELHSSDIEELSRHPWIQAVSLDATVSAGATDARAASTTSTATLRETLGLPRIASSMTLTGASGIGVAIIDSGIAPSSDFNGRITGFYDFTRGGVPTDPFDDYGHGTHIAGLIGSSGAASNYEFQGIAPSVRLVGLKVLDATGQGKTSDVIKAIEFVIANKSHLNVQIINLSLGHEILAPAKDDPLVQAVEHATQAGLIVVTAAGNHGQQTKGDVGYTGITSPGNAPSAITVGASSTKNTVARFDDAIADFSSRGPTWFDGYAKPNVVAPGDQLAADTSLASYLYKLLPSGRVKAKNGAPFLSLSGTSMATAVTSGVVALVLDAHNKSGYHRQRPLTANLVKAMLEFSAIPVGGADYLTQGAGEINAAGAITLGSGIDTSAGAGNYWVRSSIPGFTVIGGQMLGWGQNIIWDTTVYTGNLLYVSNTVWTSNIVWDTNIVWDRSVAYVRAGNIVWGTDAVWGANLVWSDRVIGQMNGDNIVWGTADGDNIVWGTLAGDNIVWGTVVGDNIVWGTWDGDNIVWGTSDGDNIVWGTAVGDNIVWGTASDGDNIVWGTVVATGRFF
jgi:serine protease AprX